MDAAKARKIVSALRSRLDDGRYVAPVTKQQQGTLRESKSPYPVWISRVDLLVSEENLTQKLFEVINSLGDGNEILNSVDRVAVKGEWVGVCKTIQMPGTVVSEKEIYQRLQEDVSSDVVLLYAHGGAFYVGSPAASRNTTARLAKLTGGCCLSVQYRLAPQNPFPAAVLDILVAYLSLLYPLPGCFNTPIPSTSIVLTGDSAGANLCLSLLQVILELGRLQNTRTPTVRWDGQDVLVPVPAGVAAMSAWADLTRALPSWCSDRDYDIYGNGLPRSVRPDFPTCAAWPSNPPRGDLYCDLSTLCHPLVSPTAATDWTLAPPILFVCGDERAVDSNKVIAQRALSQGALVVWQEYEAMPHIFMLLLEKLPHSSLCFERWAQFCRQCVQDPGSLRTSGTFVEVETLRSKEVDMTHLTAITVEEALVSMHAQRDTRRVWTGPKILKSTI